MKGERPICPQCKKGHLRATYIGGKFVENKSSTLCKIGTFCIYCGNFEYKDLPTTFKFIRKKYKAYINVYGINSKEFVGVGYFYPNAERLETSKGIQFKSRFVYVSEMYQLTKEKMMLIAMGEVVKQYRDGKKAMEEAKKFMDDPNNKLRLPNGQVVQP